MVTIEGHHPTDIIRVRFIPQVWARDEALEVDPEGDSTWEPTDLLGDLAYYKDFEDAFRYERWFEDDPACPDWIKDWSGPFFIRVMSVRAFTPH